ncbi:hypothetical protein M422DRAFT_36499 [Sphaerobolus stellatus SS14]|uniref:Uncharacterized protein n=1 Tax=Sphaerobolus stellatus (strain SS14) TaxID=990650 RepID=A0A0C9TL72_SPHS4|nr:hypothetical protein M422DRAFT_36499 [Sphaerobolus stellatus SS14]
MSITNVNLAPGFLVVPRLDFYVVELLDLAPHTRLSFGAKSCFVPSSARAFPGI